MAKDLNPFVAGDLLEFGWLEGINALAYSMRDDEDQTYRQWEDEVGKPMATFEKQGPLANLGIYSIAGKNFEAPLQYQFKVEDGELITDTGRYPLTSEQEEFIALNAYVQLLQSFGLGLPFLSKQMDAVRREQIRSIKSSK
jgi:hypothetical protein